MLFLTFHVLLIEKYSLNVKISINLENNRVVSKWFLPMRRRLHFVTSSFFYMHALFIFRQCLRNKLTKRKAYIIKTPFYSTVFSFRLLTFYNSIHRICPITTTLFTSISKAIYVTFRVVFFKTLKEVFKDPFIAYGSTSAPVTTL